nr:carboxypeptidase regulatory-like domain-containing protein [bacterium]
MMKKVTGCAVALALAIFASGCGGGGGGGGGDSSDDVCGGATLGCLTGVVQDATGAAINGAQVTYEAAAALQAQTISKAATALTTTNAQGWFSATGLPQGDNVICFEATGYVKKCSLVTITAKENTPLPPVKLPTRATAITITNVETGGKSAVDTITGAEVLFTPANAVCDSAGTAVTGDIDCYLTPQDVTGASMTDLVPESFVAVSAAGTRGTMVSSAIMELTCEQNGAEVNLCSGKTATVRIPVYGNDTACKDTTTNPATLDSWRYDESAGLWREYETADFTVNCGGTAPGTAGANQYYQGDIDHMTWINGDRLVEDACLTGVVYASADVATNAKVTVTCWGSGWRNQVQVDANGRFCIPVPKGFAYTCNVGDSSRWIDAASQITGVA